MGIKNRKIFFALVLLSVLTIFLFFQTSQVSAQQTYFCAERTINGAWCQNVPQSEISTGINPLTSQPYRSSPSSCETTAFCKTGTCVNGLEGTCLPNVPQVVCQEKNNGVWIEGKPSEVPQCQLGCCYIGDGASFVTQTRCSRLSALYGLETNFDGNIKDQNKCLLSAFPKAKGACVIDDGFSKGCKFSTRAECQDLQTTPNNKTIEFHEGFLCTAAGLGTKCGQTTETLIIPEKDEVYWKDSCGNPANIYDASKANDQSYWTNVVDRNESCQLNYDSNGNPTNAAACGNCNYFEGSVGKAFKRGDTKTPTQPSYGDFVCSALNCKWQGQNYKNGETWCATTAKDTRYENLPGSESFKLVCSAGEVTIESCSLSSDGSRAKTCKEEEIVPGFKVASCKVNKWQDCILNENQKDCENTEKRDCKWTNSVLFKTLYGKVPEEGEGICVPKYAPGFNFYDSDTAKEAQQLCAIFNGDCLVKYEKGWPFGAWECVENCECEINNNAPGTDFNNLCHALGDCGVKTNYIGVQGWNTENYNNPGTP